MGEGIGKYRTDQWDSRDGRIASMRPKMIDHRIETQPFTLTLDSPALYDMAISVSAVPNTEGVAFGSVPSVVVIPTGAASASGR